MGQAGGGVAAPCPRLDRGRITQPFGFRPHGSGRAAFPQPRPRYGVCVPLTVHAPQDMVLWHQLLKRAGDEPAPVDPGTSAPTSRGPLRSNTRYRCSESQPPGIFDNSTRQHCQLASNTLAQAALRPSWASEMTSLTPLSRQAVCAAQDHAAAIGDRASDPAASSLTLKIRPLFIAQNQDRHRRANTTRHRNNLHSHTTMNSLH